MSSNSEALHPGEAGLPTLPKLGIPLDLPIADTVDPLPIAEQWLERFTKATAKETLDIKTLVNDLLLPSTFQSTFLCPDSELDPTTGLPPVPATGDKEPSVYWRDILALTWDFRTFEGSQKIEKFLQDRLANANIHAVKLDRAEAPPIINTMFPDMVFLQLFFTFETDVGGCTAIVRLVPVPKNSGEAKPGFLKSMFGRFFEKPTRKSTPELEWKAHTVFTRLESLHNVPELLGPLRNEKSCHEPWDKVRNEELAYKERDPTVLIVGAGQSGLTVAANLKVLGVEALMVDKAERVGDNWRKRYEALCLHDPVWYDHLPYIPFPKTWPVYTPAKKLADWLEFYVNSMDLNVWLSSTVTSVKPDPEKDGRWEVTVVSKREDGEHTRIFHVNHVVFASGWNGGKPRIPDIAGRDRFKGQVLHSFEYDQADDHRGKKVVVVGSCTSAFDISTDYVKKGIDVTMFQRKSSYVISATGVRSLIAGLYSEDQKYPLEMSDRLNLSMPNLFMAGVNYRTRKLMAELDRDMIEGLEKRGYHVNTGYRDTGLLFQVWVNGGGYYFDVGGCQHIIDGRLKVKGDCGSIKTFTESGLEFEDGSRLDADVVVFCTGQEGDPRQALGDFLEKDVVEQCSKIWGLDTEGEIQGCYRDLGPQGLWSMMGNLALCRIHSKHVALQIKAMEEGVFGTRYSQ